MAGADEFGTRPLDQILQLSEVDGEAGVLPISGRRVCEEPWGGMGGGSIAEFGDCWNDEKGSKSKSQSARRKSEGSYGKTLSNCAQSMEV